MKVVTVIKIHNDVGGEDAFEYGVVTEGVAPAVLFYIGDA